MPRRSDMIRSVFRVACVVRRRGCRPSGNRRRRVPCQLDIRSRKHRLSRSIHYLEETVFRSEPHPSFPILRIFIQAKALAPGDPDSMAYQAAQAADTVGRDLVARGVSFCMETVFSDPQGAKLAFLTHARALHYVVLLVFIGLDTGQLAIARVVAMISKYSPRTRYRMTYGVPGTTSSRVPDTRPGRPRFGSAAKRSTVASNLVAVRAAAPGFSRAI